MTFFSPLVRAGPPDRRRPPSYAPRSTRHWVAIRRCIFSKTNLPYASRQVQRTVEFGPTSSISRRKRQMGHCVSALLQVHSSFPFVPFEHTIRRTRRRSAWIGGPFSLLRNVDPCFWFATTQEPISTVISKRRGCVVC